MRAGSVDLDELLEDRYCSTCEKWLIESATHVYHPEHELGQHWLCVFEVALVRLAHCEHDSHQSQACLVLSTGNVDDHSETRRKNQDHWLYPLVPALELTRGLQQVSYPQQGGSFLVGELQLAHQDVSSDHDAIECLSDLESHQQQEPHLVQLIRGRDGSDVVLRELRQLLQRRLEKLDLPWCRANATNTRCIDLELQQKVCRVDRERRWRSEWWWRRWRS